MEGIQLFYPKISLSHVVRVNAERGSPKFKLINQFCFQETFKFVVEYLLNVEVTQTKQNKILKEMKFKSLSELCDLVSDFQRTFSYKCSKSSNLSNVGVFRNFLEKKKTSDFSFQEVLFEFLNLFDVENNQNSGFTKSGSKSQKNSISQNFPTKISSEKKSIPNFFKKKRS